ncbi:pepsin F-like protein [Cricetulus griseus]|nr:pepsin F-like protein [Cricetulus griseus]
MRENLREDNMLKDYLEKYPGSGARVLPEQRWRNPAVTYEPMRNYLDIGNLTVVAQAFGLSLEEPGTFMEYAVFDGILGLGYPDLSLQGILPVFDNLWMQGLIPQNLFAFYLSSISVNGEVIACEGGCQGIMDTGTSLLTGPRNSILNIHNLIGAKASSDGEYVLRCDTINTLPDIVFTIDVVTYPVPASAYIWKGHSHNCYSNFEEGKGDPSDSEMWVLGDVFLRLYFTVFDRASNRIGLAPAV